MLNTSTLEPEIDACKCRIGRTKIKGMVPTLELDIVLFSRLGYSVSCKSSRHLPVLLLQCWSEKYRYRALVPYSSPDPKSLSRCHATINAERHWMVRCR